MRKPFTYKNKWALITGATSGIGYEFAVQLAEKGCNLLLVARSIETLRELKHILSGKYGITIEIAPVDLSEPEAPHQIVEYVKKYNIVVHLLVNNAGFGLFEPFYYTDQDDIHRMNMVNMMAPADLMSLFVQGMRKRGEGGIINVASLASFQPLPYMTNYAATKSYLWFLSAGLHQEVGKKGVHVTCLSPGPVKTNFTKIAGMGMDNPYGKGAEPASVVRQALIGLEKNKVIVVPKEHQLGMHILGPFMPTKVKLKIIEKYFKP